MGDGPSTQTSTDFTFSPEALRGVIPELFLQAGQLDPIQNQQLLRAASLTRNQPGAVGAPRRLQQGPTVRPAVNTAFPNAPPAVIGQIIEAIRGQQQRGQAQQLTQANQILSGITSIVDPRNVGALNPDQRARTSGGGPSDTETAIGAAGVAVSLVALAV